MSRSRIVVGLVGIVALLATLTACGGGSDSSTTTTVPVTQPVWVDRAGTWTVLVYLDADNNLEAHALRDMQQMTAATTTDFIVLIDRAAGHSAADIFGLGDFTDSAIVQIKGGTPRLLETPGEVNMGSPDTLASFVSYGLTSHRGAKNALVIWDHGGSWRGVAWDDSAVDPADPTSKDRLTLAEVAKGTRKGLADAGVERLDLFGFDACLMATYEVAATVAPFADVMVASEETEPGHGWNWTSLGTGASGATTSAMADAILQGYSAEATAAEQTDVTLSSIDLHAIDALTAAIDGFTESLRDPNVRIGRVGYGRNEAIGFGRSPDPDQDYFSVDLGALATELERIDGMKDAAAAIHEAVHAVVMRRVSGPSATAATGVAAYFPPVESSFDPTYDTSGLAPSWSRALRAYYAAAKRVPDDRLPTFLDPDRELDASNVISDDESVELIAKVQRDTGGNIISGFIYFGELAADGDLISVLGDVNAEVAGDTVSGTYGWRALVIGDGVTTSRAYASVNLNAKKEIDRITVPIVLTDGSNMSNGSLVLNMDGENILAQTFFAISDDGMAAVEPQEGLWFIPLFENFRLSTETSEWLPATPTPLATAAPALSFDFSRLAVGTRVFAGLGIQDIKGGVDLVIHRTTAPAE